MASAGFVSYEMVSARKTSVARLQTVAQVIAANTVAPLSFQDPEAANANLSALRNEPRVRSACLYDDSSQLFASYVATRGATGESDCAASNAPTPERRSLRDQLIFSLPIELESEPIGTIVVRAETVKIFSHLPGYLSIGAIVMLVSCGVAMILASRLQGFISIPILNLVSTSRRISVERNYSIRAEPGGDDEIGLLIDSFNEMLDQIQFRDHQLELHRDNLDDEVKARTRDLENVVEELRSEIHQRKRAEARIRELAYYDVTTGLPNRQLLRERLESAILGCAENGEPLALLFLDLDRFKEINDSFGHATGDRLLAQVAERLMACVRQADHLSRPEPANPSATVSRQGGDEFTVLLTAIRKPHDAGRVCLRIMESLARPFLLGDREVVIGASIGVAIYPDDGTDADTLIKHADTAMYHAKRDGGKILSTSPSR